MDKELEKAIVAQELKKAVRKPSSYKCTTCGNDVTGTVDLAAWNNRQCQKCWDKPPKAKERT